MSCARPDSVVAGTTTALCRCMRHRFLILSFEAHGCVTVTIMDLLLLLLLLLPLLLGEACCRQSAAHDRVLKTLKLASQGTIGLSAAQGNRRLCAGQRERWLAVVKLAASKS